MDAPTLKRAASAVTVGVGGLLWLAAILFMAQTAQNSEQFSRLHPWILMINIAGLAVLVGLLATKLAQDAQLIGQFHAFSDDLHTENLRHRNDRAHDLEWPPLAGVVG